LAKQFYITPKYRKSLFQFTRSLRSGYITTKITKTETKSDTNNKNSKNVNRNKNED